MTMYAYYEELAICFMCGEESFAEEKIRVQGIEREMYYTVSTCTKCGTEHINEDDFPLLRENDPHVQVMNDQADYL